MDAHRITLLITIDNTILYKQDESTFKINIMMFIKCAFKQLFMTLKKGLYKNKNLEEAVNNGEFKGWI